MKIDYKNLGRDFITENWKFCLKKIKKNWENKIVKNRIIKILFRGQYWGEVLRKISNVNSFKVTSVLDKVNKEVTLGKYQFLGHFEGRKSLIFFSF